MTKTNEEIIKEDIRDNNQEQAFVEEVYSMLPTKTYNRLMQKACEEGEIYGFSIGRQLITGLVLVHIDKLERKDINLEEVKRTYQNIQKGLDRSAGKGRSEE
jgi:hypothetical protein